MQTSTKQLPEIGFLRFKQIVPDLIPVSRTCWVEGVKSGKFPQPIKLSPKVTVWRVEDIRALIARLGNEQKAA